MKDFEKIDISKLAKSGMEHLDNKKWAKNMFKSWIFNVFSVFHTFQTICKIFEILTFLTFMTSQISQGQLQKTHHLMVLSWDKELKVT